MARRPPPTNQFEKCESWLSSGHASPESAEFDDIDIQKDEIYQRRRSGAYEGRRGSAYEMKRTSALLAAGIVRSSLNIETPIQAIRPGFDDDGSETAVDEEEDEDPGDPYADIPLEEADILKRQVEVPDVKVGFKDLFRYATPYDFIIITLAALNSITLGAAMPLMTVSVMPD